MDNFEDARAATESLFGNQQGGDAPVGNDGGVATDTSDIPLDVQAQQLPTEQPEQAQGGGQETQVQTNAPAPNVNNGADSYQAMAQTQQQLQEMQRNMQAMTEQNAQLQNMVRELSAKNEENIIKNAVEMPTLDIGGLAFADEDELRRAQTDYANNMRDYLMAEIREDPDMRSLIDEAKRGKQERDRQQMIESFRDVPELNGFEENLPMIDRFVKQNNDIFKDDTPMDLKYIIGKAVVDGMNAKAAAEHKPTTDELMKIYNDNSDFRNAVEQQRLAAVKGSQQVPLMSASSGAVNAALNIPEKPKTFDDADNAVRRLFGSK